MHLEFHWHLLVQSQLVTHDSFALSLPHVYEHVGIGKVFAEPLDELPGRLLEHGLSNELERTEVSTDSLPEGVVSINFVDLAVIELVPRVLQSGLDERVVVACIGCSSMHQN